MASWLQLREGGSLPAWSAFRLRFWPFSSLTAVMSAPGIPDPVSSATSPDMALVVSPCAGSVRGTIRAATKAAKTYLGMPNYSALALKPLSYS